MGRAAAGLSMLVILLVFPVITCVIELFLLYSFSASVLSSLFSVFITRPVSKLGVVVWLLGAVVRIA